MNPSTPGATPDADLPERALRLAAETRKRVLDPVDRFSEVIFGLVMVLTFTGTIRVAESGREEVRELLHAALGCSLAWGIVDAVMYAITSVVDRARKVAVLQGIHTADPARGRAIVRAAMPEGVAALTDEADADRMAARARALPHVPIHVGFQADDLKGAAACCILTLAATLPPALPFLLLPDLSRALVVSNAVTIVSLFLAGWGLGKVTGIRPGRLGLAMVLVGAALIAVTIALGG
jgi:VIT1/CCC1 family predicted Fe2+/Mn2+ transporter